MILNKEVERLTIHIVHQDAVIGSGGITDQMRMVELVAHEELFLHGSHVLWICPQFGLQSFQEVQLTVKSHSVALTCAATDLQQFCVGEGLPYF